MKAPASSALPALGEERGERTRAPSPGSAEARAREAHGRFDWRTIARHQAGALASAALDFGVMIALVQSFGVSPVASTAAGASAGAIFNFALGRRWIFQSKGRAGMGSQAIRYSVVSLASLLLNTFGEFVVHDLLRVQYVAARLIVAVLVSLAWNYPLHRAWVFAARAREA